MNGSSKKGIILVGFMGSGKTTVGREIARQAGVQFVDLDALIVSRSGLSIPEIFAAEGEEGFRARETDALRSLGHISAAVVATGGGIVGREENWLLMRRLGTIAHLRTSWDTLRSRLTGSQGRPLADDGDWPRVHALWQNRQPFYARADIVVDTDACTPLEVAERVIAAVGMKEETCRKK